MTKFAKFLEESKIDPRRVIAASRLVERLTQEDRTFLAEAARKRSMAGKKDGAKTERKKLHSNRPVTPSLIDSAKAGKPVSGPAKTRLLRAVNRILEQKKQSAVDLRVLF
ncbi:MAG: hypothetical protein QM784_21750 [Polyangiaceae bacterium]